MRFLTLVFFLLGIGRLVYSQEIWTVGPMLHVNFGGEKTRLSYGLEVAYWNINHFYYSVDGGIEFERNRMRIYSEMQTGLGLAGIASGPVLEINRKEETVRLGFQGSLWANYFLGADFRMRWINKNSYKCVGMYVKVPIALTGFDDSDKNHHNYYHHHHH